MLSIKECRDYIPNHKMDDEEFLELYHRLNSVVDSTLEKYMAEQDKQFWEDMQKLEIQNNQSENK